MNTCKLFYAGLETRTLNLLGQDSFFEIAGCAEIDSLKCKTFNFFNLPLKCIYRRRIDGITSNTLTEKNLRRIAFLCKHLTTGHYRKFNEHILFLSNKNIRVYEVTPTNLGDLGLDIIVANVWDMLPVDILKIPKKGTINIHPSRLPQYRGAVPTLMSLANGDTQTAVSYMILAPEMDRGGILYQHSISIDQNETSLSLEEKIFDAIKSTFLEKIKEYLHDKISPKQQDEKTASYTPKHETYRLIDGSKESAREISNKVSLYPYLEPDIFCYIIYKNEKIYLKNVRQTISSQRIIKTRHFFFKLHINTTTTTLSSILFIDIDFNSSLRLLKLFFTK